MKFRSKKYIILCIGHCNIAAIIFLNDIARLQTICLPALFIVQVR